MVRLNRPARDQGISTLLQRLFGETPAGQGEAMEWLNVANGDLGGKRPVSMIVSDGSGDVLSLLEGIARGV